MKWILVPTAAAASLFACTAYAGIPLLNGTCPGNLSVHADEGGPVYVNGKETKLKRFNDNYYEAKDAASGVTLSISINPDGSPSLSYTGKNRANGVCQLGQAAAAAKPAAAPKTGARESHPAAEKACLAAVAKTTQVNANSLSVISAEWSQAGTGIKVKVPGAEAPWACMVDDKGKVWNVSYTGSEGKL